MGGRPCYALLSLALPPALDDQWLESLLAGVGEMLAEHGCALVGGDTVRAGELSLSVTVLGQADAGPVIYRSGGRVGDLVLVSGPLGSAAAGLALLQAGQAEPWPELARAHLDPDPQVELGRALAAGGLVTAMQDLSDGLATDLAHLCQESGLAARLKAAQLPRLPRLTEAAAKLGREELDWVLRGGEDYQLVYTVAPQDLPGLRQALDAAGLSAGVVVGELGEGHGVRLDLGAGREEDIEFQGFEHR